MDSLVLQPRDRQILDLLRDQGFASFEQLCQRFFPNRKRCSKRLILLVQHNYITSKALKDYLGGTGMKGFFPYLLGLGINGNSKLYFLAPLYRKTVPETNRLLKPDLCLHQLMLNSVRFFLEDQMAEARFFLSDPQVQILSDFQLGRRKEFTPDISVEHKDYIMAVELERTVKSKNRYASRFWYYKDSTYTHVLYFYVNEAHLNTILKQAGPSRKFGFAHYLRPNQVLSKAWGYLDVNEWIDKVQSIQARPLPMQPTSSTTILTS